MKVKIKKETKKEKVPPKGASKLFEAIGAKEPETYIQYFVHVKVILTQAEKKILRDNDLSGAPLCTYYAKLPEWEIRQDFRYSAAEGNVDVTVANFLHPEFAPAFNSVHEMNAFVSTIQREAIPRLKQYLTEAADGDEIVIEA